MRLMPGLVRIPDLSFFARSRLPGGEFPEDAIPDLTPDLVVEVLSEGNTRREMNLKVRDYFLSGTRLAWLIDLKKRTIQVYTAPDQSLVLREGDSLDGGEVLPGLSLPLTQVFARIPKTRGKSRRRPGS
jgi:Uma2 family endonuclease